MDGRPAVDTVADTTAAAVAEAAPRIPSGHTLVRGTTAENLLCVVVLVVVVVVVVDEQQSQLLDILVVD